MLDFHIKHNSIATMGIKKYSINSPYGEVNQSMKAFHLSMRNQHINFANAGIYVLNPECVDLVPKKFDMTSLLKKLF